MDTVSIPTWIRNTLLFVVRTPMACFEAKGLNPVVVFVKTDEGNQTPVAFKTGINVKAGKDVIGE